MQRLPVSSLIIAASLTGPSLRAQDTLYFPPPTHIAIRAMRAMPALDGPGLHVWTVNGTTSALSVGDIDSGAATALHHHTREQIDVELRGTGNATLGDHAEPFPPGYGIVIPADVSHSFANHSHGVVTMLEFHTVPRPDLVPPHPKVSFPAATDPLALPANERLAARMDVAQGKTFSGRTCSVRWRSIDAPTDVHPGATPTELFIYVAEGSGRVHAEGQTTAFAPGTLLIIPATLAHTRIEPDAGSKTALVEFSVIK